MNVLVDTPVWSLALRRNKPQLTSSQTAVRQQLKSLIEEGRAQLAGVVRQELLSGIREQEHFMRIRDYLHAFVNPDIDVEDYEEGAAFNNLCRAKGITGSATDFLLCAISMRRGWSIFTLDLDFERYSAVIPITLYRRTSDG